MFVDSHCHLNYQGLVEDQPRVLARARAAGVELMLNISTRAAEWDAIRAKYGLRAPGFDAYLGHSWQFIDFCFTKGEDLVAGLTSTVAIRQAGFHEAMYTDDMFTKWFKRYQADGLLPPP